MKPGATTPAPGGYPLDVAACHAEIDRLRALVARHERTIASLQRSNNAKAMLLGEWPVDPSDELDGAEPSDMERQAFEDELEMFRRRAG